MDKRGGIASVAGACGEGLMAQAVYGREGKRFHIIRYAGMVHWWPDSQGNDKT